MRHRLAISILTLILLVLSQQAAVLHELGHYRSTDPEPASAQKHLAHELCGDCLAFAHVLAGGVGPLTPVLPAGAGPCAVLIEPVLFRARSVALRQRNRDPPSSC